MGSSPFTSVCACNSNWKECQNASLKVKGSSPFKHKSFYYGKMAEFG
jgi:hypothetical protein